MPAEKRHPLKYTVLEKSLIGNEIHEAGAVVDYDGLPSENLQPMCAEGHLRYQEYRDTRTRRQAAQRAEFAEAAGVDPAAFGAAVAKAIAESNAEHAKSQAALLATLAESDAKHAETQTALLGAIEGLTKQLAAPAAKAPKKGAAEEPPIA